MVEPTVLRRPTHQRPYIQYSASGTMMAVGWMLIMALIWFTLLFSDFSDAGVVFRCTKSIHQIHHHRLPTTTMMMVLMCLVRHYGYYFCYLFAFLWCTLQSFSSARALLTTFFFFPTIPLHSHNSKVYLQCFKTYFLLTALPSKLTDLLPSCLEEVKFSIQQAVFGR